MSIFKKHWAIISFLTLYFAILAFKLIYYPTPFFDWDESLYIQLGKEMIVNKTFMPTWQGMIWLDKPPLIPLFYGIINFIPFVAPEVSTRLATLLLTILTLSFVYVLYYRVIKESILSTLIVMAFAFTPIVLQRAQVINIDIFLALGWIGFILFYRNFWVSLLFLSLSIMSKSLLGFYPIGIMIIFILFQLLVKTIDTKKFFTHIKKLGSYVGILSSYYLLMFLIYGKDFLIQHIYETHFRRVTSSLEFHFGHITYYIDIMAEQFVGKPLINYLGISAITINWIALVFFTITVVSCILIFLRYFKKKNLSDTELLYAFYLLPWFIFLNLTKTKIAWYSYPAIAQFSFLIMYPIQYLRSKKQLYYGFVTILFIALMYYTGIHKNAFAAQYSKVEPHHTLAQFAKDKCTTLFVLVDKDTRDSFATLEQMNLLITTSKWWGNKPSMVYYFEKKIQFSYSEKEFAQTIIPTGACVMVHKNDSSQTEKKSVQLLKAFNPWLLFKK